MEKLCEVAEKEKKPGVAETKFTIDLDNGKAIPWDTRKCEWYLHEPGMGTATVAAK